MNLNNLSNLFVYFSIFVLAINLILFSIALTQKKKNKITNIAMSLTWLVGLFLIIALILRGIAAQRAPWGNMYEFAISSVTAVVLTFLLVSIKKNIQWLGIFITVPAIILLGLAVIVLYTESGPLVPALKSTWLWIHVSSAIISYGAFSLNFGLSIIYLLKVKNKLKSLPSLKRIDEFSYKVVLFAFPIWTFSVISGAVWAENAWGRYWGWDPKETWALISIIIYTAVLHLRIVPRLNNKWLFNFTSIISFASIMMTYFGVNFYLVGLHSYASGDKVITPNFVYYSIIFVIILGLISYFVNKKTKVL